MIWDNPIRRKQREFFTTIIFGHKVCWWTAWIIGILVFIYWIALWVRFAIPFR